MPEQEGKVPKDAKDFKFPKTDEEEKESEAISDPKEEFGDMNMMFTMERLEDNFDEVEEQLRSLKTIIESYRSAVDRHKKDLDADIYVDEALMKGQKALAEFTINGKKFDISQLSERSEMADVYNDIVVEVNSFIEDLGKRGVRRDYLSQI